MRASEVTEMSSADKFITTASELDTSHVDLELQNDLVDSDESVVYIARLYANEPGKGYGTEVMELLVNLADRYQVILVLVLSKGEDGYNRKDLQRYYARFGFEGRGLSMSRRPR